MSSIVFLTILLTVVSSVSLTSLVPSPVAQEPLKLIAKVKLNGTEYLTIITKPNDDDHQLLLYCLSSKALNENKARIIVDVSSTPLDEALHLDSDTVSKLGNQTVLASYENYEILFGAVSGKKEVNELDIKAAKMSTFHCDDDELFYSAWLSSFDKDYIFVVHKEIFKKIQLSTEDGIVEISNIAQAMLCTKKDVLYFDLNTEIPCQNALSWSFGQNIQGFFTSKAFYIFDRENLTVISFPTEAWKNVGTNFTLKITNFSDFFMMSAENITTTTVSTSVSTIKTYKSTSSSETSTTTTKKTSTSTIIIIVVSSIVVATLLIVFLGTVIYCCCCLKKDKKKKKKKSSKKRSSSKDKVIQRSSKRRHSSSKKSSKEKKTSKGHNKTSKRSFKKESKRRKNKRKDSKRKDSKDRKSKQISSSRPNQQSRVVSKVSRKYASVSKVPIGSTSKSTPPVSSLFSSRYLSNS